MRPVTITNNQYYNGLWIQQVLLTVLLLTLIGLGFLVNEHIWWLLPFMVFLLMYNHRMISFQQFIQISMSQTGNIRLSGVHCNDEAVSVNVKTIWCFPSVIFLQLKSDKESMRLYSVMTRKNLGVTNFSLFLMALSLTANQQQIKHENE